MCFYVNIMCDMQASEFLLRFANDNDFFEKAVPVLNEYVRSLKNLEDFDEYTAIEEILKVVNVEVVYADYAYVIDEVLYGDPTCQ